MKLLILGDVMGTSGRDALKNKLPKIIEKNKIDFVIVNGENAADDGRGITESIAKDFLGDDSKEYWPYNYEEHEIYTAISMHCLENNE